MGCCLLYPSVEYLLLKPIPRAFIVLLYFSINSLSRKMIPILHRLLTFIGGNPTVQKRSEKSHNFHSKISVLGLIFAVFHFLLLIYCDFKSEEEMDEEPDIYVEKNNIMRGLVELGRVITFLQEPVLAVTSYRQSKALCGLLMHLEDFDEYLETGVQVKKIRKKMLHWDRIIASLLFLVTCVNYVVICMLFIVYYKIPAYPHDIYTSMMPITNYLLHISVAGCHLLAISMRMNCYNYILEKFFAGCRRDQCRNI